MSKFTAAILLGAGLMIPLAAQDHDRDDRNRRDRYYDTDRKDYHPME